MAPRTTTSMNTHMATEPTTRTKSSTSSENNGRGKVTKPEGKKQDAGKHNISEANRRTNIRGEYLRLKEMIPSIKDVDGIEKKEKEVLIAFDTEARQQIARRHMLIKKIADMQQAIKNA